MRAHDDPKPTRIEAWLEARSPGYQFGYVLVLLLLTYGVMAAGPPDNWARLLTVLLEWFTLMAALLASRVGRRLFRLAAWVGIIAFFSAALSLVVTSGTDPTGIFFGLNVLLCGAAPIAIGSSLYKRRVVDLHTVAGAICIYVLLGMMFSFFFAAIDAVEHGDFFVQTSHATLPNFLYFSFVTLTTTGYGDYTAAGDVGRAFATLEALMGQLYLVTVVAVLVSRMASQTPRITASGHARRHARRHSRRHARRVVRLRHQARLRLVG
ncbi:MAG: potassium channel family protein [Acidimicrobiia bacterium]